jgi:hypothetical protein
MTSKYGAYEDAFFSSSTSNIACPAAPPACPAADTRLPRRSARLPLAACLHACPWPPARQHTRPWSREALPGRPLAAPPSPKNRT